MLRALFILLAVVSFVLAVVLAMPELYVAAGALVVIAIIMLALSAKKRHDKSKQSYLASSPSREHDEELAALGIADIRPRGRERSKINDDEHSVMEEPGSAEAASGSGDSKRARKRKSESESADEPALEGALDTKDAVQTGDSRHDDAELRALGIMEIRPRQKKSTVQNGDTDNNGDGVASNGGGSSASVSASQSRNKAPEPDSAEALANRERMRKEVLSPYLQSLQSAIGANTVCLLRHDDDPLKYHIEAIVSKNAYARSQGHFRSRVPLLTPAIARRPVLTFRIGEKGIASSNLGYYLEPIAVKQIAVTNVPRREDAESFFLLVDTMDEGGVAADRQHSILSQYANLLGTLLGGGETDGSAVNGSTYRSRREIIDEEITRARSANEPLALVLLYLNEAESIAEEGEEAVNEAEAILEGRLREVVEGRRMEHFGELVYGVFYNGEASEVEPWVVGVQEQLTEEAGPLSGGMSIGIAVLKDRHDGAEAFRADANAALQEAYETGECTIVE